MGVDENLEESMTDQGSTLKEAVRRHYAAAAKGGGCGCSETRPPAGVTCCGPEAAAEEATGQAPGWGCGNPLPVADPRPGEAVLDLGCGAGAEVLRAARMVGPRGRAVGVDMTDEMLERAREALRGSGLTNVEFLKGEIESLPLPGAAFDLIISNCVLNLSPDKALALREAFRVLKPGGRFVVADVVIAGSSEPDAAWRADLSRWSACEAGAMTEAEYARALSAAGFTEVGLERIADFGGESCGGGQGATLEKEVRLVSDMISAKKPADHAPLVRVQSADLPGVSALLETAGLDPAGLTAANVRIFAMADATGTAASVAIEVENGAVLLRSLAVRPDLRGRGLGEALLEHALEQARHEGIREAFLLTETAAPFFAGRGWTPVERDVVDARFPESEQVRRVCPASATAMRRSL
ncbi:MAG TPA: GNAT family N-acetyltransferase [Gemmatimonadota bacterium]|jgi:N-acetylglutamate synthase-like GNAT family acetyltransferase/2-polyprenyl-3-methyl-5-hydroxy-6-metoxy-1,4-benzoquinol methylase